MGVMRPLLAAVLLSCLAVRARAQTPAPASAPASQTEISVVSVDGGVLRSGQRGLSAGAKLKPGQKLALSGGEAVLALGDEGKVMLKGATIGAILPKGERGFSLAAGAILSALPHLKDRFVVRTNSVTAAVRGTEFFVQAVNPHEAYVCVCSGKVDVNATRVEGKVFALEAAHPHTAWSFHRSGAKLTRQDDVMRGHDDGDLAKLK
jgi:ferric-dicitrate binding protein FerR (iron transport regulator)